MFLTALSLTLNRFEFVCHFFLTDSTLWTGFGSSASEVETINRTSTFGWTRYAGSSGQVIGMHTFGASAPLKELQKKFGFTPEAVYLAAKEQLAKAKKR